MSQHNRLPVYLLLDTSGSMTGEPINQVEQGIRMLLADLRNDGSASETAYLSVITFNSQAEQITPLQDVFTFEPPVLKTGGVTALGEALEFVAARAQEEVIKKTPDTRGDWRPIIILMSDGEPTDDWKAGLEKFRKVKWAAKIACAVNKANRDVLREVISGNKTTEDTPNYDPDSYLVAIDTAYPGQMKALFEWLSGSIKQTSQSIGGGNTSETGGVLPPLPDEIDLMGI